MNYRYIPLLLIVLLASAGCYRQAETSFEPIDDQSLESVDNPSSVNTPIPDAQAANNTDETSIPVTLISATNTQAVNPTEPIEPTLIVPTNQNNIPITPLQSTLTPRPTTDNRTPLPTVAGGEVITPDAPSGPITFPSATLSRPSTTGNNSESEPAPTQGGVDETGCLYTVVSGDSLFRIAINQDVSLAALREANPQISGDFINVGDVLSLPGCIATNGTIIRATSTLAPTATATPIGGSSQTIHTVASGETLFSIALKYGVTVDEIVEANNLDNPNSLSIGQELIIPD